MKKSRSHLSFVLVLSALLLFACQTNTVTPVRIPPASNPAGQSGGIGAQPGVVLGSTQAAPTAPAETIPPTTAAPTTAPQPIPTKAPSTGSLVDLHSVDWNSFLATDPELDHPSPPPMSDALKGPYVIPKGQPQDAAQGFAVTDGILYHHFSDDGQEAAVISLFSGGTAGNLGLLIYKPGPSSPVLVAWLAGYKIGAIADGDKLLVREPIYSGWEPNCCNSGWSDTRYRLSNNKLVTASHSQYGEPGARKMTVEQFYQLLSDKKYQDAYNFLSPAFRAQNPFAKWQAGYQNTVSFTANTSERPDGLIGVDLVATDSTASGQKTTHYQGTWSLVWSDAQRQWLLDSGKFAVAP